MTITLHLSPYTDQLVPSADGDGQLTELQRRPYPLVCNEEGIILNVSGTAPVVPRRVIGFVGDPSRQEVDLWWRDVTDHNALARLYAITANTAGRWSTHTTAIERVEVT